MCRHHGLFEPSYPIGSMSVIDLQKAALGSTLFNRRMKRLQALGSGGDIPTLRPRETKLDSLFPHGIAELVPGGRYLLTGSIDFANRLRCITLWDLGVAGPFYRVQDRPKQIALVNVVASDRSFFRAIQPMQPCPGEKSLRFMATSVLPQGGQTHLSVQHSRHLLICRKPLT
jgi:hypothetical protein